MIVLIGGTPIFVAFDLGSSELMTGISGSLSRPQGFLLTPLPSHLYTPVSLLSPLRSSIFTFFSSLIFYLTYSTISSLTFSSNFTPLLSFTLLILFLLSLSPTSTIIIKYRPFTTISTTFITSSSIVLKPIILSPLTSAASLSGLALLYLARREVYAIKPGLRPLAVIVVIVKIGVEFVLILAA